MRQRQIRLLIWNNDLGSCIELLLTRDRSRGTGTSSICSCSIFLRRAVVATPSLVSAAALGDGRDSTVTRPARLGTTEKCACCRAAAAMELTVTRSQGPVCAPLGSWWVHRSCQRLWSVYFFALYFDFHLTFTMWHGLMKTIAHLFPLMEVKERKKQKKYTENN